MTRKPHKEEGQRKAVKNKEEEGRKSIKEEGLTITDKRVHVRSLISPHMLMCVTQKNGTRTIGGFHCRDIEN